METVSAEAKIPRNVLYILAVLVIIFLGVSYQSIEFLQIQKHQPGNYNRQPAIVLYNDNDNLRTLEALDLFWIKDVIPNDTQSPLAAISMETASGTKLVKQFPCEVDPLDDRCKIERIPRGGYVTGFPEIPLTPETALLCDENINIRLGKNTETVCPNDPTCKKCARNYNETKRLLEHFHQGDNERRDRLQKWFPIPKGKESRDIIVCSVNFGQLYLFLNWACSCWKNQVFDVRLYTWIIPTDTKTYNALVALGFNAEPLDWMSNGTKIRLSSKYTGSANSGPHAQINSIAAFASNFAVQMGFYTLLMDVDMVFLHNPFPWLHRSAERRDVLGMYSPRSDNYGFMNSGFLFFVPTEKTKILLESYENLCLIKSISDQQLWNVVIRHYSFRQVGVCVTLNFNPLK
uniref:Nucleotide-diphospho-sugar transferase domain-containing protein n=1 Tax=Aplanochytrium stocchinoi TaxID=215587 RepID=A0A7S3LLM1_9STRA